MKHGLASALLGLILALPAVAQDGSGAAGDVAATREDRGTATATARSTVAEQSGADAVPGLAVPAASARDAGPPSALDPDPAAGEATPAPAVTTSPIAARHSGGGAIDRIDLGATSITGNQELPKVLYIVPWQRSDLGGLIGRPVDTLLDEVLAPIDPEVFERQLSYYETLHGQSEKE